MVSGVAVLALYQAFGVGFQELVIIGLIFLLLFGPSKLPQMARDLGRFVTEARRSVDEFREELLAGTDDEDDGDVGTKDKNTPKVRKRK
jgi:Tat protein translocase TatB subunit